MQDVVFGQECDAWKNKHVTPTYNWQMSLQQNLKAFQANSTTCSLHQCPLLRLMLKLPLSISSLWPACDEKILEILNAYLIVTSAHWFASSLFDYLVNNTLYSPLPSLLVVLSQLRELLNKNKHVHFSVRLPSRPQHGDSASLCALQ